MKQIVIELIIAITTFLLGYTYARKIESNERD